MKIILITLFAATLFAAPILMPKYPIRYSQFFAEKTITVTEELTIAETWTLPSKKGFICFEKPL